MFGAATTKARSKIPEATAKRRVIFFDRQAYELSMDEHKARVKKFQRMKAEAEKHFRVDAKDLDDLRSHPAVFFERGILSKYEGKNPMGLSATKIIQLMEIDVSGFYAAMTAYQKDNGPEDEPKKSDFEKVATTPEQIERLDKAEELIRVLTAIKKDKIMMSLPMIAGYSVGVLHCDASGGNLRPGPEYVLNG